MNITMIAEMAASSCDRAVVTVENRSLTAAQLLALARRAADRFRQYPAVLYLGTNHLAYPVALFGAAMAGVPFVPLNYRLGDQQLAALIDRHPGALVLRLDDLDDLIDIEAIQQDSAESDAPAPQWDGDSVAAIIYTSGTTADPKPAILRHRHLLAYVLNTMEFSSADENDASLVAVPPYHIAGLTNLLSNLYTGRRIVYLAAFDAKIWLDTVRGQSVTHAMLVPTMLARVVAELGRTMQILPRWQVWRTADREHPDRYRARAAKLPGYRIRQCLRPHGDSVVGGSSRPRRSPDCLCLCRSGSA